MSLLENTRSAESAQTAELFDLCFQTSELEEVIDLLSARSRAAPFAYVVTPNVDHVVRLHRNFPFLSKYYQSAWLTLCDSRIIQLLGRLSGVEIPACPGPDVTASLFRSAIAPADSVTVIGCPDVAIKLLREMFGLRDLHHYNPPMGFIRNPEEIQKCVDFVINHPSRFVFFAVGSPQQEITANAVYCSGRACGIGLCIGMGIHFLVGIQRRAPVWVQRARCEWLHRLIHQPRRLWRRYLVEGPAILKIFLHERAHKRRVSIEPAK